jgi:hypothetical protein
MQGFITDFGAPYPPPSVIDFDANGQNPYVQKVFPRAAPGVFPPGGHLDGDQVLVFFLGGPDGQGFSTNPANPMQTSGKRRPPNYEFPQSRLYFRAGNFRSYKDPYGNPYLYFGSGYGGNDYNGSGGGGYLVNGSPVTPYQENGTKFFNSHSFQIICGGKNGLYGPGGLLTPGTGNFAVGSPGGDDLTNFWPGMLSSSR